MVGRDRILARIGTGLASGPRAREFTSVLLGPRGAGKTVFLTEMEERAASNGWIVVSLDASTAGIAERVRQGVVHARDTHEGAAGADPDQGRPGRWSGVRLGPISLQRAVLAEVRPEWDMRHLLAKLAEHAQRAGTAVLMTLDELHSGDRDELRRLSADLQHITKRSGLPLAVIAAGLSEMKLTLLMDKKMTFFRRCARLDMPDLTVADALQGLRLPVLDAGATFDQDALRFAARACGPLPYTMQLVGYNAWKIAGAPDRPIDMSAAQEAVPACFGAGDRGPHRAGLVRLVRFESGFPHRGVRARTTCRPPASRGDPDCSSAIARRHRTAPASLWIYRRHD